MAKIVRLNIIKSMMRKEASQLKRDTMMMRVLFGAPIAMILVFGYALTNDVKDVSIAVFDQDKTQMSRAIVEKFTGSGYFYHHYDLKSPEELNDLMDASRVEVYINIENGLSKKIKSGKDASIQVILDGSNTSRAAVTATYVTEIMNDVFFKQFSDKIKAEVLRKSNLNMSDDPDEIAEGLKIKNGVRFNERIFFNPTLLSRNFFMPAIIAMLITVVTIILTSMAIVKEREIGTIEQITVSPIKPLEFVLGKTLLFAIIGFFDIIVVSTVTILWFNIPFNGSFLFLLASGFFYILTNLSVGIYISSVSKTQQQAMLSVFLFFLPAIILSGFVFPIYSMPEPMQLVTYVNPLRYYMNILRGIFLKGIGVVELWQDITALIVIGTVMIFFSVRKLSRRLE